PLDGGVTPAVWAIVLVGVGLVSPGYPAVHFLASEQFQVRAGAALLDQRVLLVGLARMFLFAADEDIDLAAPRRSGPQPAFDAEQQQFGDVAEVEADAASVGAAVLA